MISVFEDIVAYEHLADAFVACLLTAVTCGIVGSYVVARRMVFLSGGITHASFGGLGIAFYLGANPILGATIFAILSSMGIEYAGSRTKIREDSAIGLIWGIGMAIGALFMNLRPGYTSGDLSNFLFGNIITVTSGDVMALAGLTLFLLIGAALWLKPVMYVAFDRDFAKAAGVRTKLISYAMSIITAITIVLSIRIMGIVLLISLLTMPVVIANTFSKNYRTIAIGAAIIASIGSLAGIALSYYLEVPSGPAIIFILTLTLIIVKLLSLHTKHRRKLNENIR
jgi:zinc transport system permease protein